MKAHIVRITATAEQIAELETLSQECGLLGVNYDKKKFKEDAQKILGDDVFNDLPPDAERAILLVESLDRTRLFQ